MIPAADLRPVSRPQPAPAGAGAAARGFTLVEVAAVVLIIGLVAAISMGAFSSAFGSRDARSAEATGKDIDGALLTYARKYHHLPCPDINGNSREGDASGNCATSFAMGYLPYESLELEPPASAARAVYGVYRNAAAGADLVRPLASGTPAKPDFQRALIAAAKIAVVDDKHVFVTGDGAATGAVDCAANRVLHPAYAIVIPVTDRDGDGSNLDGVDVGLPSSGSLCLASPNAKPRADFDDHVAFTGFTTLLGLISTDSP